MKAFVKTNNGTFPNVNFYLAWEAFNQMGYSVTCFEEKDIDTMDVSVDTPVFAGTLIFQKIMNKLGINYQPFDCYPEVLKPYYNRNLIRSTVGVEKEKFHKDGKKVFVKPVKPKVFIGAVWESLLNIIPLANVPDDTECWVCEPIEMLSEYRVYVHDGDILGVKHYYGDWSLTPPSKGTVERIIKDYKPSPISYGIDFAVYKKQTATGGGLYGNQPGWHYESLVVEVNDACNLGNYGLDSIHYGEMLVSRWFEIVGRNKYTHDSLKQKIVESYINEIRKSSDNELETENYGMRIEEPIEKRVFTIDCGNINTEELNRYMENMMNKIKKVPYIKD